MEVFNGLNYLRDIINKSRKVPMSDMVVVNRQDMLDAIEMIKKNLPTEILEAKKLIENRNEIIIDANKEAEVVVKEAEQYAAGRVTEHELTMQAKKAAEEMLNNARINSKEIRIGARDYANELLLDLKEQMEVSGYKLIEDIQEDFNNFAKSIQKEYRSRIETIREGMEELKKYK